MTRHYDDWIKAYLQYSSHSESPDKFHFWTAVSTLAGAIRRRCIMDMGYFEWVANCYIIFVAPPGIVSKSTTANIGMNLLRQVPHVHMGPQMVTWQALTKSLEESRVHIERRNGTVDAMCALTIASSELGNLLDTKDDGMTHLLIALWDGQREAIKKVTKTMGSETIDNPYVNLLGCTTPAWISRAFPDYMIEGGLTSRCVFVYGEKKRHLNAYPGLVMTTEQRDMEKRLVEDLVEISNLEGHFVLSKEAVVWGTAWYAEHHERNARELTDYRLQGYMARKQTHLHKLAMVLSASRRNTLVIEEQDLLDADNVLTGAETDMPRVFANIGYTQETRAVETLIQTVCREKCVPQNRVYLEMARYLTASKFEEVVKSAVLTGCVKRGVIGEQTMLIAAEPPRNNKQQPGETA